MTHPFQSYLEWAIENFTVAGADSILIDKQDLRQIVTPSARQGAMNVVTRFRSSMDEVDIRVTEALEPYNRYGVPCWWIMREKSSPQNLERVLNARGFTLEHEAAGLLLPLATSNLKETPEVTIERVDAHNLRGYMYAALDGNPGNEKFEAYLKQAMAREGERIEFYFAQFQGEPAGTACTTILPNQLGNLMSGFVRPKYRGRGIYHSLVARRAQRLKELGIPYAAVLAKKETSAPILERMGFQKITEFRTLERNAVKKA